jgi:hypothetical protein
LWIDLDRILYETLYTKMSIFSYLMKAVVNGNNFFARPGTLAHGIEWTLCDGKEAGAIKYEWRLNPLSHVTGPKGDKSG